MSSFEGFEFHYDNYPCRIIAWSEQRAISFSMELTEMQYAAFNKMYEDGARIMLVNAMKRHIYGYIKYIEGQNKHYNKE